MLLNNAALALQAIALLQACCPVSSAAIIQGLKDVTILGRFQVIQNNPRCIVDIAHNPQASQMLLQQITQLGWQGQLHIVFSMLSTKDMVASLIPWQHCPAQWYVAELSEAKAASLDAILENFQEAKMPAPQKYGTIEKAYQAALTQATGSETILIFGSFHTVAACWPQSTLQETLRL